MMGNMSLQQKNKQENILGDQSKKTPEKVAELNAMNFQG